MLARWLMVVSPFGSNTWCELRMIDDGETGQFTNCYWEYLSYLHTNNPGPRHVRPDIYIFGKNFHHRENFRKVVDEVREDEIQKRLKMFLCRKQKSEKSETICCFIFVERKTRKNLFSRLSNMFCWYQTLIKTDLIDLFSKGISLPLTPQLILR